MKLYKEFCGVIIEFENIKSFILFTLGRVCGIFVFLLLLDAFFYYIHLQGYNNGEEYTSIFTIIFMFIKIFI